MLYNAMLHDPECTKFAVMQASFRGFLCCHSFVFIVFGFRFIALAVFLPSISLQFFRSYTQAQHKADEGYASKYTKRQRLTLGLHLRRNGEQAAREERPGCTAGC
jgi:hypothetical protein